jgi:hypothetical protein
MDFQERLTIRYQSFGCPNAAERAAADIANRPVQLSVTEWEEYLLRHSMHVCPDLNHFKKYGCVPPPQPTPSTGINPMLDYVEKLTARYVQLGFGDDSARLAKTRIGQWNRQTTPHDVHFRQVMAENVKQAGFYLEGYIKP